MNIYAFPYINRKKLSHSTGLEYEVNSRKCKVSLCLTEENVDFFREVCMADSPVEVGYRIGDDSTLFVIFSEAYPIVSEIKSVVDEPTVVEVTFHGRRNPE